MGKIGLLLVFILSISIVESKGQINIDAKISEKLAEKQFPPPVHNNRIIRPNRPVIYDINSIQIIDLKLDESKIEQLPSGVYYEVYKNINCSNESRGWVEKMSFSKTLTLNRSVSYTKNINSSKTLSANLQFKGLLTGSASSTESVQITNTRSWSRNETITTNLSRNIDLTVQPYTELFIKLERKVNSARVPFKATVIADGSVTAEYTKICWNCNNPRKTYTWRISNILSESERLFTIEGYISNSSATGLEVKFYENELDRSIDCDEIQDVITAGEIKSDLGVQHELINVSPMAKNIPSLDSLYTVENFDSIQELFNTDDDVQIIVDNVDDFISSEIVLNTDEINSLDFDFVIEEYINTTTIFTDNSVSPVNIRHLSYGPGICNVNTFSSSGNSITTNAPPAIWSEWQEIDAHLGPTSFTYTNQINCDTGVRSQIRYSKR